MPLQQESEDAEVDEENNTDEEYTHGISENDSDSDDSMINGNAVDAENVLFTQWTILFLHLCVDIVYVVHTQQRQTVKDTEERHSHMAWMMRPWWWCFHWC